MEYSASIYTLQLDPWYEFWSIYYWEMAKVKVWDIVRNPQVTVMFEAVKHVFLDQSYVIL